MVRWLSWLLLPLAIVAVLKISNPTIAKWEVHPGTGPCVPQPFALQGDRAINTAENGDVLLAVNGTYLGAICQPGVLTYQARGDLGEGRGARLMVATAEGTLFNGELPTATQSFKYDVPAGPIAFVFEDDSSGTRGDRNVWLFDVAVTTK